MKVYLQIVAEKIGTKEKKIVEEISMGQSQTTILFTNGLYANSIDYRYYHNGKEIDIYNSALFNPYIDGINADLIFYMPTTAKQEHIGIPF